MNEQEIEDFKADFDFVEADDLTDSFLHGQILRRALGISRKTPFYWFRAINSHDNWFDGHFYYDVVWQHAWCCDKEQESWEKTKLYFARQYPNWYAVFETPGVEFFLVRKVVVGSWGRLMEESQHFNFNGRAVFVHH